MDGDINARPLRGVERPREGVGGEGERQLSIEGGEREGVVRTPYSLLRRNCIIQKSARVTQRTILFSGKQYICCLKDEEVEVSMLWSVILTCGNP